MICELFKVCLCMHSFLSPVLGAGLVGLAISYALSVTNLLSGVVTSFTETEKQMVSVERAMQYIRGAPAERDRGREEVGNSSGVLCSEYEVLMWLICSASSRLAVLWYSGVQECISELQVHVLCFLERWF